MQRARRVGGLSLNPSHYVAALQTACCDLPSRSSLPEANPTLCKRGKGWGTRRDGTSANLGNPHTTLLLLVVLIRIVNQDAVVIVGCAFQALEGFIPRCGDFIEKHYALAWKA